MKKDTQLRIRINKQQFARLMEIMITNGYSSKSDFIRDAIEDKIKELEHQKNKESSRDIFQKDEMDHLYYDLWEMIDVPNDITGPERRKGLAFLDFLKIDINEDQLITIDARPVDLANMYISFIRKSKS